MGPKSKFYKNEGQKVVVKNDPDYSVCILKPPYVHTVVMLGSTPVSLNSSIYIHTVVMLGSTPVSLNSSIYIHTIVML